MKSLVKDASEPALLQGALAMWFLEKTDKARDLVDKALKAADSAEYVCLLRVLLIRFAHFPSLSCSSQCAEPPWLD